MSTGSRQASPQRTYGMLSWSSSPGWGGAILNTPPSATLRSWSSKSKPST